MLVPSPRQPKPADRTQICTQIERPLGFISSPGYSLELRPFKRSIFSTHVSSSCPTGLEPRRAVGNPCGRCCLGTGCLLCSQAAANEAQASNCSASWFPLHSLPLEACRRPKSPLLALWSLRHLEMFGMGLSWASCCAGGLILRWGETTSPGWGQYVTLCCSTTSKFPSDPGQLLGGLDRDTGSKATCREDFCQGVWPHCAIP